jgi:hypothetical protein
VGSTCYSLGGWVFFGVLGSIVRGNKKIIDNIKICDYLNRQGGREDALM